MSKKHTCRSWRVDAHEIHTCNSPKLCKGLNFPHPEWAGWITSPSCLAIYVWLAAQANRDNEPWRWWMAAHLYTIKCCNWEGKHRDCDGASHLQVCCLISIQSTPLLHGSQGRRRNSDFSDRLLDRVVSTLCLLSFDKSYQKGRSGWKL